jgi:hypothetical protein
MKKWNRYFAPGLLGLALFAGGCAARDVDVSQRGGIRSESNSEGDNTSTRGRSTSESQTQQNKSKTSSQSSGSSGY